MNLSIFISILFGLQILYWGIGRWSAKNIQGEEDYFFAGKQVPFFPLMMTFLATQVGGGLVLGAADEAYLFGWPVLLYPAGAALGLILLGCGMGRKLAAFQLTTVAQIFETVYRSVALRRIASFLSVVSLFMILVAQIIASNKFLISLGIHNVPLFFLFWSIVIIYTAYGGLKAVIATDIVQASFFSLIFFLCFGWIFFHEPSLPSLTMPQIEGMPPLSSKLCGWLFMPLLFMVIEQDMGQRCFAGLSPKVISKASFVAGVCTLLVCVVPVFLGCLAKVMGVTVPTGGSVLMATVMQATNPWMSALVGCAVLAAIISTATSLINAIGSNLASDFKFPFLQKIDPMRVVRGTTSCVSIGAIFCALYFNNIVDLLIQSYELSVSCLFVPIIFAIFRKQGSPMGAILAMSFGGLGFVLFRLFPLPFPKELASVFLSFLGYGCGEMWGYAWRLRAAR